MSTGLAALKASLEQETADPGLIRLYGEPALASQRDRYRLLLAEAEKRLTGQQFLLASAPGRTELGGNHTDHNNGRVLASAVDLDCVGVTTPTTGQYVTIYSADYPEPIRVDLKRLTPQKSERGTPQALIRGIAAARSQQNRKVGAFSTVLHSTCKPGTGLSSSAAFSVLIGGIFATLFDQDPADPLQLARDGRYAENEFFGKPCGLMDQLSSAAGYTLGIDFKNPDNPELTRIESAFERCHYRLLIIDTGGSHSSLTADYAAVTEEISRAVAVLGTDKARGIALDAVLENIVEIRRQAGDRALLRLLHFIAEDQRAADMTASLQSGDFDEFLQLVRQSGDSSCRLLQNCSSATNIREQGILLAMALTSQGFPETVCRVHGGGFAGTVQAYVPHRRFDDYQLLMEQVFGEGAVIPVVIGRPGFCYWAENGWVFAEERP